MGLALTSMPRSGLEIAGVENKNCALREAVPAAAMAECRAVLRFMDIIKDPKENEKVQH